MSETRRILTPYVSRHWPALAGVCGSTAVLAAAELAGPWPLKLVIDRIAGREAPFELGGADIRFLALVAGLVLAIALVGALAAYTAELWLNRAAERIVHDLRVAVYAHLQRLSLAFHHRRPTGDLVSNVTGDVAAVRTLFADSAGEIASSVLLLAGMLTVTLLLDPALALATFAVTPALALVTWRYTRRTRVLARKQRAQEGEIASLATEALSAMQVVKAFGSEAWEQDRVRARSERRRTIGVEAVRTEARFAGLVDVIGAGAVTVAMVVGVFRVSAGALSPGDLIVFVSYAGKTYKPLRAIAKQLPKAQRGLARAERIAEVLASAAILVERPGAYRGGRAAGEVALRNVSFAYEPSRSALHDVSVRIAPGERVVVVGRSGAGKSTLGALVARLYDPDEGVVTIDGRDARDCSLEWLREQVGVLLQETVLFSGTVADNIAYATDATHDEIVAAARAADAHGFVSKLPGGYDTMLGPRGAGLSGGQRQRIGIARVLLRDPAVLVLDEPTTGLDAASEAEVMEGLDRLMADRTTIIVTHSRDLASRAARTLVVEDGRLVADRTSAGSTTHGARGRVSVDPTLPAFSHLLDAEVMTSAFERSLGRDVERVAIVDARLKPGRELVVRYDVEAGGRHTAVALIQSRPARLARTVARRAPATEALSFDEELGALIQWLPLDIALPALALPREDLLRRVEAAGVAVDGDAIGPELLSYKPLARAVMRLDGHVLKVYDDERRVARAARGLAAAAALDLRTPQLEAASPELCAVVQSRLEGRAPDDPRSAATEAGGVLRLVHALPATAPRLTARDQLDRAAKHAAVVTTLLPALAPRLERLLARLADAAPGGEAVLSHGDFESGQLLRTAHGPGLLDLDDVCVAAPALDFANYASHVVHGTQSLDDAYGVLAELADGYGGTPAELEWHLAAALVCRSPTPFRRFQDDWPARVESLVEAAEAAVRR